MPATTAEVLTELNGALGTDYRLVRRLAGGFQSGAYELSDGRDRVVLKWSRHSSWAPRVQRAAELVRRAKAVGYPTPGWLAVGTTADGSPYQLQEFVDGTPLTNGSTLTLDLAEQLVEIVELQRGLVNDAEPTWSGYVHAIVFEGRDGTWESVRRYDEAAAELIAGYERVCEPYRDEVLPVGDLVHGDLNAGNLIVADGRIAGVIDIEAAGGGTRAYDLVSLAASAAREGGPDEYLLEAALRIGGRAVVAVCAASAYATIADFAFGAVDGAIVNGGGRRLLELLLEG